MGPGASPVVPERGPGAPGGTGRPARLDTAAALLRAAARRDLPPALARTAAADPRLPARAAAAAGFADSALRAVLAAVLAGRGGERPLGSPGTRTAVAGAFADLLAADALVRTAARGGHLLPGAAGPWTTAADHLVPRLLPRATAGLLAALGADWLRQEHRHGVFHRHLQHLETTVRPGPPPTPPPRAAGEPPDALFTPGGPLPPPAPHRPGAVPGPDPLAGALRMAARRAAGPHAPALRDRFALLGAAFDGLGDGDGDGDPVRAGALGERYALLVSAASCAGVWAAATARDGAGFLAHPAWLLTALDRTATRLGLDGPRPAAPDPDRARLLLAEAVARVRGGLALGLGAAPSAGGRRPAAAP
ncbi:hypothetical protein ACIQRS_04755 [Streptomyces termitum]|uniref:Uncharacterized protein n=1 Tax=Streptomyces termitum TaxID=67368 RepID=A0A918SXV6_9ACTN|nr:hypothetical protein [Streptomyces termitum]GHA77892.1 hypothetical protein GCM10010305_21230 [Streptomyces termitum]